ncbi:hypothetical protein BDR04DRAFT_1164899 [Suillus decipiens]|nr:hypothetical protein BDR04DRAFT_1164899 [Suillus decipiens]
MEAGMARQKSKGKGKVTNTASGPTSGPKTQSQPKPKPKPRAKAKAKAKAKEILHLDTNNDQLNDQEARPDGLPSLAGRHDPVPDRSQHELVKTRLEKEPPPGSKTPDPQQQAISSTRQPDTGIIGSQRPSVSTVNNDSNDGPPQTSSTSDDRGGISDSAAPAVSHQHPRADTDDNEDDATHRDMDIYQLMMETVNDEFVLDGSAEDGGPSSTQNSTADKMDVEIMLGARGMAKLKLSSQKYDDTSMAVDNSEEDHAGVSSATQKRRRDTASSSSVASPPTGPMKSPPRIRRPRKKVIVAGDGPGSNASHLPSNSESSGPRLSLNTRVAVPVNAPKPRGLQKSRGRGSHPKPT